MPDRGRRKQAIGPGKSVRTGASSPMKSGMELSSAAAPIQAALKNWATTSAHCGTASQWQLTGDPNACAHGHAAHVPQENTRSQ